MRRINYLVWFLLFLCGFIYAGSTPVQTVDLSGTWDFNPDNDDVSTIQVPGGGWLKQGFDCTEADYSRSITIPDIGQPQVTRLEFGAVNYQADLYIDEAFVASSVQSYTPASFDITDYVTPGNTYTIRVHVKGRYAFMIDGRSVVPNAAGWSWDIPEGIFRSAELLIYPQVYIEDVFVRPYVSSTTLYYDVWLRNDSTSTKNVTLSGTLDSWNGDSWSYPTLPSASYSLPADSVTKVTVDPVDWNLGSDSYWWPNVPYQEGYTAQLHNLNLSISGDGSHSTTVRFGFRECTQGPDGLGNTCYFLNGIRVNFRGDNLQGADYDNIVYNGGRSDAYDTLPGFLPPSEGNPGWPKAVDNYQRLNFNVNRIHQQPCTPYMLDVCDEMGLMIIEETAIRGSADDQDFIIGHDNMVNHLKALFTRDRNHASIVRQSLSNEPDQSWWTDSVEFAEDLYDAAMLVDGTRPLSIDAGGSGQTYERMNSMDYPNFSVYRHYVGSDGAGWHFAQYTDEVLERPDRPYGQGEYIWPADNTPQGFCWFGTSAQAMRAKGASDIRPYTLLSAWASIIPGVNTTDMWLEQGGNPLFGEDNLPDPWSDSLIQRVQAGFNPVLVADTEYWTDNKYSNGTGDWPAKVLIISPGEVVTRELTIYNDTFSGTAVDVFWELRQDSATGPLLDSGVVNATVPLGYGVTQDITFTAPNARDGTIVYLVLYTKKNGVEMFRETSQSFLLARPIPLVNGDFETTDPEGYTVQVRGFDYGTAWDGSGDIVDIPGWHDVSAVQNDSGTENGGYNTSRNAYLMGRGSENDRGAYQMTGYTIQQGDVFYLSFRSQIIWNGAELTAVLFYGDANVDSSAYEIGSKTFWPDGGWWSGVWNDYTMTLAATPESVGSEIGIHFVNTGTPNDSWIALDDVSLTVISDYVPITETDGKTMLFAGDTKYTDDYSVILAQKPLDDVRVTVTPPTGLSVGNGEGQAVDLTFTDLNWDQPQIVTVSIADTSAEADVVHIQHTVQSNDPTYNNFPVRDVPVYIQEPFFVNTAVIENTIDEKVYGHFFEHIYHSANGGLWGELVWNRSFELPGLSWFINDSKELMQLSFAEDVHMEFGDTAWDNYELTLQAKKDGGAEGFLIVFRAPDSDNFYWLNLGGWGNSQHAIEKERRGDRSVLESIPGHIKTDQWYDITVRCEDDHFQVWLAEAGDPSPDPNAILDCTDDRRPHLTGNVGVGTWATQARFRNIQVTDLSGSTVLYSGLPSLPDNLFNANFWTAFGSGIPSVSFDSLNDNYSVEITGDDSETGLQQDNFEITQQVYEGSLWMKGDVPSGIQVELLDDQTVLGQAILSSPTSSWDEYSFSIAPNAATEDGSLRITLLGAGTVKIDQVSVMAQDAISTGGYRPDLLEAVEGLSPPIIRWPGGCFASLYLWKDAIGPQHTRRQYPAYMWEDQDTNSYGTDEFLQMCEQIGAEPLICINTGILDSACGAPAQWKLPVPLDETEMEVYIQDALDWMEYCNGSVDTEWGAVRAANGHPEPYNVTYWEIDNETWAAGPWAYIQAVWAFVPELQNKAAELGVPIKISVVGSGGYDQSWNRDIIDFCAPLIDYISVHYYEDPGNFKWAPLWYEDYIIDLANYIAESENPEMKIYNSEWNAQSTDWRTGLFAGGILNTYERQGENFEIGGPALFLRHTSAGGWDNAFINFDHTGWFPAPNYVVMKLWHDHYAPNRIQTILTDTDLNVVSTLSDNAQTLYIKIVNPDPEDKHIKFEIDGSFVPETASMDYVAPGDLYARNTLANPNAVDVQVKTIDLDNQGLRFIMPAYSAGAVTVTVNRSAAAKNALTEALEVVNTTDPGNWKNAKQIKAMSNKLKAALKMVDNEQYQGVLEKLSNDILDKTNGCAEKGAPDKNDWIRTCEDQADLYPLIVEAIGYLESILND